MRRSDKEVKNPEWIASVLRDSVYCHIAMCDQDRPYVIPMNFAWENGHLILHSATEGKKIQILRQNPRISFAVETDIEPIPRVTPCGYSMRFRSVCGYGIARLIEESEKKAKFLEILAMKYFSGPIPVFSSEDLSQIVVIEVDIKEMVGKNSGY